MLILAGITIGCFIGYAARCLDEQQAKRNGWRQ